MSDLYLNIGSQKLTVSIYRITGNMSEALNNRLDENIMESLFKEFPPLPSESREAYDTRYKKWVEDKNKEIEAKKEETNKKPKGKKVAEASEEPAVEPNETLFQYVRRSLNLTKYEDQMDHLYRMVECIATTFDNQQNKCDREALKNCPLIDINNFVFRVCKYCRISSGLEELKID